jgi:hypothetical protein
MGGRVVEGTGLENLRQKSVEYHHVLKMPETGVFAAPVSLFYPLRPFSSAEFGYILGYNSGRSGPPLRQTGANVHQPLVQIKLPPALIVPGRSVRACLTRVR